MNTTLDQFENTYSIEHIFSNEPPPFAIIYRSETNLELVDLFVGKVTKHDALNDIPCRNSCLQSNNGHDVLVLIPYQQIKERNFDYIDDGSPLIAMQIQKYEAYSKKDIFLKIKSLPIDLENEGYNTSDDDYKKTVLKIINEEIGNGAGANFVLKRTYKADIKNYNISKSLSIFKNLLNSETGAYWTYIVYTGDRVLVGASPELHVSLSDQTVTMNPISGTYRYPKSGFSVNEFLHFLDSHKEMEELYMVVDEELKMMSRLCDHNCVIDGPYIKEMTNLAHTGYLIKGKTSLHPQSILKETLFAPTITGSPLENACRIIKKYEPEGRGYYSGIIALISNKDNGESVLDSSIIIRTANITNDGKLELSVGSTIVRHSDPESECLETESKASSLLKALNIKIFKDNKQKKKHDINHNQQVAEKLKNRNLTISKFWQLEQNILTSYKNPKLIGLKTLILDAEDTFTSMIFQLLKSLSLNVAIKKLNENFNINDYDLYILGPGPGDPNNKNDVRVVKINNLINELIDNKSKFIAICLSHQVLCRYLGFSVLLKSNPNQGTQKEINLFDVVEKVGFYNSYSSVSECENIFIKNIGEIEMSKDNETNEIHALRSKNFSSMQFHPESILTQRGFEILESRIVEVIDSN